VSCKETSRSQAQSNAALTSSTNSSAGDAADVREPVRESLDGPTIMEEVAGIRD